MKRQSNSPINRHNRSPKKNTMVTEDGLYNYSPICSWGGCGGAGYFYPDFSFEYGDKSSLVKITQAGSGYSWGFNGCEDVIQLSDSAGTHNKTGLNGMNAYVLDIFSKRDFTATCCSDSGSVELNSRGTGGGDD